MILTCFAPKIYHLNPDKYFIKKIHGYRKLILLTNCKYNYVSTSKKDMPPRHHHCEHATGTKHELRKLQCQPGKNVRIGKRNQNQRAAGFAGQDTQFSDICQEDL